MTAISLLYRLSLSLPVLLTPIVVMNPLYDRKGHAIPRMETTVLNYIACALLVVGFELSYRYDAYSAALMAKIR